MKLGDPKLDPDVRRCLARVLAWPFRGAGVAASAPPNAGAVDVQAVVRAACACHVAGPFERNARLAGLALSAGQIERLQRAGTRVAMAHARTAQGLKRVAAALHGARVPFLVLKGAALNAILYERADERLLTDIDILVRPGDARPADAALQAAGCRRGPDLVRGDFYPRFHYERGYDTPSPGAVRVDVHVRPLRPLRCARTLPQAALWSAPRTFDVDGRRLHCPGHEDMLIHLAAHSGIHGNVRLVWLLDLLRFVERFDDDIDWVVFGGRVRDWRLVLAVRSGLRAAAQLFEHPRLAEVARTTSGPSDWRDALALRQAPRDEGRPFSHLLTNLATTPGLRFRAQYLAAVLSPGRSHLGQVYPWRHPGWPLCAHGWRALRALGRPITAGIKALRPGTLVPLESSPGSG